MEEHRDKEKDASLVADFIAAPRKAVWKLSLPVMMGMAVYTFYNLTDMYFVGMLGGEALAALTFNMPVVFLALGIVFGLGTGATSAIARSLGAGDKAAAEDAARQTLTIGLGLASAIILFALIFKSEIMASLGASDRVAELAVRYFEVAVPGFVFIVLNVCFRSIMTGEGNTRTPMTFQALGTLLNIALDPVLIFWAGLGIAGAAWATVVSQGIVLALFIFHLFIRKGSYLKLGSGRFALSRATTTDVLRVGLPSSASMILMSFGLICNNRIVAMFGGEAVAGLGVGGRIDSIFFMPIFALASSQVTLAGMYLGARRADLIRQTLVYAIVRGEVFAIVLGVSFFAFAPPLCATFTADPRIAEVAVTYVRTIALSFPFVTVGLITGRAFQGLGSGVPGLIVSALRVVVIPVPIAFVATRFLGYGLTSVWWSIVAGGVASSLIAFIWIAHRLRQVEGCEQAPTTASSPAHAVQK